MSNKELIVAVRAVDQASSPLKQIGVQFVDLGVKANAAADKTARGMGTAGGAVEKFGKLGVAAFAGLGAAIAAVGAAMASAQLISAFRTTAQELETIGDASAKLGVSVETFSELRYAAKLAGVDVGALSGGISNLEKEASKLAATGKSRVAEAFRRLGIDVRDGFGELKDINDLLPEVMAGIAGVANQAERVELTRRIFGDDQFLVFLNDGADGLKRMAEEARRMGVVFDDSSVKIAGQFTDAVDKLNEAFFGLKARVVVALAPAVTAFIDGASERLAKLAGSVQAVGNAMRVAAGNGPEADAAGRAIDAAKGPILDLALTLAKESAVVFVVGVTAGLRSVAGVMAADFGKALLGVLPESVSNALGFSAEFNTEAKLKELQNTKRILEGFKNIGKPKYEAILAEDPYRTTNPTRRMNAAARMEELNDYVRSVNNGSDDLEAALAKVNKQIQAQTYLMGLDTGNTAKAQAVLVSGYFKEMEDAIAQASERIAGKADIAAKAIGNLQDQFGEKPAAAAQGPSAFGVFATNIFRGVDKLPGVIDGAMRKTGEAFENGWERVLEIGKRNAEETGKLVQQAMAIRFELFPEEKVQAELAKFEDLVQRLKARGQELFSDAEIDQYRKKLMGVTIEPIQSLSEFNDEFAAQAERINATIGKTVNDVNTGVWNTTDALYGMGDAWVRVSQEANNAYAFAERFVSGISFTLSAELGTAITDVISGTQSLGDAFGNMASSVLKQISEMIFQMLALRAIMSIGNAFGFGGLPVSSGVVNSSLGALAPGMAGGGTVTRTGYVRGGYVGGMAGGGMVGGGIGGRDSVLAKLMPGEGILNRSAVAANPGVVDALNRGGRVGGGDGGSVVIHQTINVTGGGLGGGIDARTIEGAAFEGLMRAMRSATNRDSLRVVLGGR